MVSTAEITESLTELGLTEYEARCYVALTQLSRGTAKEVSQVSGVPQSRVYDVTERLYQQGLIDVQESEPRTFRAMPPPVALKRLRREYNEYLEKASEQLEELQSRETDDEGVWKIATEEDVVLRAQMHVEDASEEVYLLVTEESLLEDELLDALDAACRRGVSVFVEVPDESVSEQLRATVPEADVRVSPSPFTTGDPGGQEPGRLLLVDRTTVLLSEVSEGLVPQASDESGMWGRSAGHGLTAWLRPLLVARLETVGFDVESAS
ncbi:TrmB family transcriptional regulator [Halopelagius fulvigenes]|uniref:TrmB family transcriptional regulator n=1 Tax=Halopelagius fulvigenes TaxID=1198324 RepID=A0ABD5TV01_9EURY